MYCVILTAKLAIEVHEDVGGLSVFILKFLAA